MLRSENARLRRLLFLKEAEDAREHGRNARQSYTRLLCGSLARAWAFLAEQDQAPAPKSDTPKDEAADGKEPPLP